MVEFTNDDLMMMGEFERLTRVMPSDFINTPTMIVFLVEVQNLGKCIGKGGSTIAKLKELFKKKVVVVANAKDLEMFIRSYFSNVKIVSADIRNIMGEQNVLLVVDEKDRGIAIGREGERVKALKEILKRKFNATVQIKASRSGGFGVSEDATF